MCRALELGHARKHALRAREARDCVRCSYFDIGCVVGVQVLIQHVSAIVVDKMRTYYHNYKYSLSVSSALAPGRCYRFVWVRVHTRYALCGQQFDNLIIEPRVRVRANITSPHVGSLKRAMCARALVCVCVSVCRHALASAVCVCVFLCVSIHTIPY